MNILQEAYNVLVNHEIVDIKKISEMSKYDKELYMNDF